MRREVWFVEGVIGNISDTTQSHDCEILGISCGVFYLSQSKFLSSGGRETSRGDKGRLLSKGASEVDFFVLDVVVDKIIEDLVPSYRDILKKNPLLVYSHLNSIRTHPQILTSLEKFSNNIYHTHKLSVQNRKWKKGSICGGLDSPISSIKTRSFKKKINASSIGEH